MYFDPISSWLVALLVDGAIILSEKTDGGYGREFERNEISDMNNNLNAGIRRIKDRLGFISPERQLDEIKRIINCANKSFAVSHWGGDVIISKDNQDYILELLEACVKKYRDDMKRYVDNTQMLENARAKADKYQDVLDKVSAYKVMRYEEESAERINELPQSDANIGCLMMALIGIAAVLCVCGIVSAIF